MRSRMVRGQACDLEAERSSIAGMKDAPDSLHATAWGIYVEPLDCDKKGFETGDRVDRTAVTCG